MRVFYLPNWVSGHVTVDTAPWAFRGAIPEQARTSKQARAQWLSNPNTRHYCYSCVEGVNPHLRVTLAENAEDTGNPPHQLWGLIADYDRPLDVEQVLQTVRSWPYPPMWVERTLSGHWRLIWGFAAPLPCPSGRWAKHFLQWLLDQGAIPLSQLPGLDKRAWCNPAQYYVHSGDWREIDRTAYLPAAIVTGWAMQASQAWDWRQYGAARGLPEIPLDVVAQELAARFPQFQWPQEFRVGSRGPSFWIPGSDSPSSAIVTPYGMQTFSAEASRGFYSWSDLLGREVVDRWTTAQLGQQVQDIYFDGRCYYRRDESGRWVAMERTDTILYLRAVRKISPRADKQGISDVERALAYIQEYQRVDAALPLVYYPSGILREGGRVLLNIAQVRPLSPASCEERPPAWGENFEWLARFLSELLGAERVSLEVFLAWVHRAYAGYWRQRPVGGQILFVIGPPGVGKTLLAREVLGRLFGGFAEAAPYLMGEDTFNSELFRAGLWVVDDDTVAADWRRVRRWTAALKRTAANPSHRFHEKYRSAGIVHWRGRLVVTANMDPESLAVIPDLSASMRDKVIMLRAHAPTRPFPPPWDLQDILTRELPYFAAWLLHWVPPAEHTRDARYGTQAYVDAELRPLEQYSSTREQFAELLALWLQGMAQESWQGTALQLYRAIHVDPSLAPLLHKCTPSVAIMARRLEDLAEHPTHWVRVRRSGTALWELQANTIE